MKTFSPDQILTHEQLEDHPKVAIDLCRSMRASPGNQNPSIHQNVVELFETGCGIYVDMPNVYGVIASFQVSEAVFLEKMILDVKTHDDLGAIKFNVREVEEGYVKKFLQIESGLVEFSYGHEEKLIPGKWYNVSVGMNQGHQRYSYNSSRGERMFTTLVASKKKGLKDQKNVEVVFKKHEGLISSIHFSL